MVIKKREEILSEAYRKCDECVKAFNKGKLELILGCGAAQTLETRITQVLNGIGDVIGKISFSFAKVALFVYFILENNSLF